MAHRLRAMAALSESSGLTLSTHMAAGNFVTRVPRDLVLSSPQAPGTHAIHRHAHTQNTHTSKPKK